VCCELGGQTGLIAGGELVICLSAQAARVISVQELRKGCVVFVQYGQASDCTKVAQNTLFGRVWMCVYMLGSFG
jgi:hypothetical protein